MTTNTDWLLGIDFGTSNTAAAHSGALSGNVEALALSHSSNLMPSAVYVDAPDRIAVGDVAANEAERNPAGYLPAPKRLIGQPMVAVNGQTIPSYLPVAAVLRTVLNRALAAHAGQPPHQVVLTHPEAWSPLQIQVLFDAARYAGIDPSRITTISEPRAAAQYYTRSHTITPGQRIAVFDFGGGTLDIAVLTATPAAVSTQGQPSNRHGLVTFDVIAARGDNGIGGKNFDALIRRWVDDQLESRNPDLLQYLRGAAPMAVRQGLDNSIRRAKELLSEAPSATITVAGGGFHETLQITRDEFEELIRPVVERALELTRGTLRDAAITSPDQLSALYLTGGSSRVPLIQNRLRELGPVATLDDPKTVVAQGALVALHARSQAQTQPAPTAPAAAELMPSWQQQTHAPGSATASGGGRNKLILGLGGAAVAVALVAGIVALTSGDGGNGGGDNPTTTSSSVAVAAKATTTEQVLASLPSQLRDAIENCKQSGFTYDREALEVRCDIKADSSLAAYGEKDFFTITVSSDVQGAKSGIIALRQRAQDEDTLVESSDRHAAALIEPYADYDKTNKQVNIDYVNDNTGLALSTSRVNTLEDAKRFLSESGLING